VFDALVDITVDDVTYFSINNMSKQINVTRPTIYNTLKVLQKDDIMSTDFTDVTIEKDDMNNTKAVLKYNYIVYGRKG